MIKNNIAKLNIRNELRPQYNELFQRVAFNRIGVCIFSHRFYMNLTYAFTAVILIIFTFIQNTNIASLGNEATYLFE